MMTDWGKNVFQLVDEAVGLRRRYEQMLAEPRNLEDVTRDAESRMQLHAAAEASNLCAILDHLIHLRGGPPPLQRGPTPEERRLYEAALKAVGGEHSGGGHVGAQQLMRFRERLERVLRDLPHPPRGSEW